MISFAAPLEQYRSQQAEIDAAVARVFASGNYILGEEVAVFERAFATACGTAHAVGVGNGTDAITLVLRALGVGPGDEVITASHTALATVAAILAVGAVPVLVEIDPDHYTLDPAALAVATTTRTKAIVAVHLYGQAADLEAILEFADKRGIAVIEDCAQSAGGRLNGRQLGSIGRAGCFSFYPTKNIGALGDGGAVVTSDPELASRVRRLRQYGWDNERQTDGIGINSRLDPVQAAILGVKLPRLAKWNERRREIGGRYNAAFQDLPLTLPAERPGSEHVYHLYVVVLDDRNGLRRSLAAAGVEAGVHYPLPAHLHPGYSERVQAVGGLTFTERLCDRILSLPLYPELSDTEVERIIAAVWRYFGR